MTDTIKNYQVFDLQSGLELLGGKTGFKFNYAILKNMKAVEAEIKLIQEAIQKGLTDEMKKVVEKVEGVRSGLKEDEQVQLDSILDEKELETYSDYNKMIEDIMQQDSAMDIYRIGADSVPEDLDIKQSSAVMMFIKE